MLGSFLYDNRREILSDCHIGFTNIALLSESLLDGLLFYFVEVCGHFQIITQKCAYRIRHCH